MAIKSYIENGKKLFEVIVKVRDKNGRQLKRSRKGLPNERSAKNVEFELRKGLDGRLTKGPETQWQAWFDHCLAQMKTQFLPSTWIGYESINNKWVRPLWGERDLSSIARLDVHRLVFEEIPSTLSPNTRRNILKAIRKLFQMAVEDGMIDRNPCNGVTVRVPEVEQKVLTRSEINILLVRAKEVEHPFYPVWFFAIQTGMRSGEMIALKWSDIDLERGLISVSKQWSNKNGFTEPKSRRNRMVPISDDLSLFLKELKLKAVSPDSFVLPRLRDWEHGEQAKVLKGFCEAIGITEIKFHDLRATFITHMLSAGVSLVKVMTIVGHSELKTTNGYLRKAGVDVIGATNALGIQQPLDSQFNVVGIRDRIERGH